MPQALKVQNDFGIERFVLVGDRGMITQIADQGLAGDRGHGLDHCVTFRGD